MARPTRPAPAAAPAAAPAPAPAPAPAADDVVVASDERSMVWADFWGNVGRSAWTIVVWGLFILLVLGPLLTVVAFSLTPSVYNGIRPTTLTWYRQLFASSANYYPLVRSLEVAVIVVAVQLVLGTLVAYATVRRKVFGAGVMDAMSNLTIALPSVVIGLALLSFYGPFGPFHTFSALILSSPLALTWTLWIVVFAHVLETFPYMVRTVGGVLQQVPRNLESAAHSLGAGRFTVFRTVILPQIKQSMLAGSVLVFSRSIAEFGATIIVVSAVLRTAPIAIYSEAEAGRLEFAAAYSVVLMLVSLVIYLALRRTTGRSLSGLDVRD
jgi:sulfate transport system permease protein